jgi:O-antigen/teichoic acid export membrane protein
MLKNIYRKAGYFPATMMPKLLSLILVVYVTNKMGIEQYALFSLIIVYGELLDATCFRWVRVGFLRFSKSNEHESKQLKALISRIYYYSLFIAALGALIISIFDENTPIVKFTLALFIYVFVSSQLRLILTNLRALNERGVYVLCEVTRPTFTLLLVAICINTTKIDFFWLSLLCSLITAVWTIMLLKYYPKPIEKFDNKTHLFKEFISYGLPLVGAFFLSQTVLVADRFVIGQSLTLTDLGFYAISISLCRPAVDIVFNSINLSSFTKIIEYYQLDKHKEVNQIFEGKLIKSLIYTLPIFVLSIFLLKPVGLLFFSIEVVEYLIVLVPILTISFIFLGIKNFVFDQVFHLVKKSSLHSYTLLPALAVNIVGNVIFLNLFGIKAAAYVSLTSNLLSLLVSVVISRRLYPLSFSIYRLSTVLAINISLFLLMLLFNHFLTSTYLIIVGISLCLVIFYNYEYGRLKI